MYTYDKHVRQHISAPTKYNIMILYALCFCWDTEQYSSIDDLYHVGHFSNYVHSLF